MASIYTDEERNHRYDILRGKKKKLELLRIVAFWGLIISIALGTGCSDFSSDLPAYIMVFGAAAGAVAAYIRNPYIAAAVIPVLILTACIAGSFSVLLPVLFLAGTVYLGLEWKKLSQEDGFPEFKILLGEYKERERLHANMAENRAVAAGTRTEEIPDNNDGMHDLLDAGHDTRTVNAKLTAYWERGQFAQAYETEQEDYHSKMKEL